MDYKSDKCLFDKTIDPSYLIGIATPLLSANADDAEEKMKCLTPDGKLMEIDKKIINQKAIKLQANNNDIKNWMKK